MTTFAAAASSQSPKELNAHDFEDLYDSLGIVTDTLGCVMLNVQPIELMKLNPQLDAADLVTEPEDSDKFWIQGAVAEQGGHATLLFGLAPEVRVPHVEQVLSGWEQPVFVQSQSIEAWPDPAGGDYAAIVAVLDVDESLFDAHTRLSFLPHVDTFQTYKPHITLAYVKKEKAEHWQWILDVGVIEFETTVIDTGEMDE